MVLYIIVLMLIGWILTLVDNGNRNFPYGIVGGIIGIIVPMILIVQVIDKQPKAIDVYQGKPH